MFYILFFWFSFTEWFHPSCVGLDVNKLPEMFFCSSCKPSKNVDNKSEVKPTQPEPPAHVPSSDKKRKGKGNTDKQDIKKIKGTEPKKKRKE